MTSPNQPPLQQLQPEQIDSTALQSLQIAYHGIANALSQVRMNRAVNKMENIDHKNALYSDLSRLALTGAVEPHTETTRPDPSSEVPVTHNPNGTINLLRTTRFEKTLPAEPLTFTERFISTRTRTGEYKSLSKKAIKHHYADLDAFRVEKQLNYRTPTPINLKTSANNTLNKPFVKPFVKQFVSQFDDEHKVWGKDSVIKSASKRVVKAKLELGNITPMEAAVAELRVDSQLDIMGKARREAVRNYRRTNKKSMNVFKKVNKVNEKGQSVYELNRDKTIEKIVKHHARIESHREKAETLKIDRDDTRNRNAEAKKNNEALKDLGPDILGKVWVINGHSVTIDSRNSHGRFTVTIVDRNGISHTVHQTPASLRDGLRRDGVL